VTDALGRWIKKPVAVTEDCFGRSPTKRRLMTDGMANSLPWNKIPASTKRNGKGRGKTKEENDPDVFVAERAKIGDIWVNERFLGAPLAHAFDEGSATRHRRLCRRTMQAELDASARALEAPTSR